jgi:hypothetical protein
MGFASEETLRWLKIGVSHLMFLKSADLLPLRNTVTAAVEGRHGSIHVTMSGNRQASALDTDQRSIFRAAPSMASIQR